MTAPAGLTERDQLLSYVAGHRAAEIASRRARRPASSPAQSVSRSLELLDLVAQLRGGWPLPPDAWREREAATVRETWSQLYRELAGR